MDLKWKWRKMTRVNEPAELLEEMVAHVGECKHCGGIVKMMRKLETYALDPNACFCLYCGQPYFMEIENLYAWEMEQWKQKDTGWSS